jgi:hypothetical protein
MKTFFEYYTELANLIDKVALGGDNAPSTEKIEALAKEADIDVQDYADANCEGNVNTWLDVVLDIRTQFKNGDRVAI